MKQTLLRSANSTLIAGLFLLVGCSSHLDHVTIDNRPLTLSVAAPPGALVLSPTRSHITFVGSAVTASHEGAFARFGGWILCPDNQPAHARLFVEIDTDSIQTAIPLLTKHLKESDFFDVQKFPRATFVTTAITNDTITGNLTLHGVTQSITCPAHWKIEPGKIEVDAKMTIHQSSFAMQSARTTNDDVPVEISIEAENGATPAVSPPLRGG
jgi:polyisoprenoid-binding protein YceI